MNHRTPGVADPENALVPFGQFERLHFARFVILEAPTADDITVYGIAACDVADVARVPRRLRRPGRYFPRRSRRPGRRRSAPDLRVLPGLLARERSARLDEAARAAVGGELRQLDRPHRACRSARSRPSTARWSITCRTARRRHPTASSRSPLHDRLVGFVDAEQQAGRLHAHAAEAPTPLGWRLRNAIDKIGVPVALLAAGAVPVGRLAAARLPAAHAREGRSRDRAPPRARDLCPARCRARGPRRHQSVHRVRRSSSPAASVCWTTIFLLWLLDYSARHIYNRGYLTRVQHDPLRPLGFPGRPEARCSSPAITTAVSRATWTTSSTRSPGGSISSSATASATRAPTG